MKLSSKVLFTGIAIALAIALILSLSGGNMAGGEFVLWFGLSCLGISALSLLISLILFALGRNNRELAQGFLLTCGALLLIGFAVCGGAASFN